MDVRLPDGTVIKNVPDGTTKAQLMEKLKANGYDVSTLAKPAAESLPAQIGGYLNETAGNVPADLMNIAQGAYNVATDPLAALQGVAEAAGSPLETGARLAGAAYQTIRHPLDTFRQAPVSTVLGATAARGLAAPGTAAANALAEAAYPSIRRAVSPTNRLLTDVFGAPELQAALQEAPPGFNVGQAIADVNAPQAQAVARQAATMVPDEARAAQLAQGQARLEALTKIARTPEELAAAEEARATAAKQNYGEAFKAEAPQISTELMNRPSMQIAVQEATKIAAETGETATPISALHNVKLALDKIVSKPEDYGLGGAQKAAIAKTRQQFIDELSMVPEYARARADFAAQSVPINKMQIAQELLKAATEPLTEGATRAGAFARAVEEAPKTIKKATGQQFFTKLEDVLSPEEMEVVNNVRDEFRRTKLSEEQAKFGSTAAPEVGELASAKITSAMNIPFLNRTWTIANTLVKRSLGRIDERLATEIGMMMQDPAELNRAIAKARRYEKETQANVEKFRKRRQGAMTLSPPRAIAGAVTVQNALAPQVNQNAMAR